MAYPFITVRMMDDPTETHTDVCRLGSGWAAVLLCWDEDIQGFDIWQTGLGRYKQKNAAVYEAQLWATTEDVTCWCVFDDTDISHLI